MPDYFDRNKAWAKDGPYTTTLTPDEETQFGQWVAANKVPWQDAPDADYDMRGFWKAGAQGQQENANDGLMHFPDTYKTPYHQSFSKESVYATDGAPSWNAQDQLVLPNGTVIYDERAKARGYIDRP